MTALEWAMSQNANNPPEALYCSTESEWRGRFDKIVPYIHGEGVRDQSIALVASIVGEIGDNCFTHNIGTWRDVRGCWFEWAVHKETRELHWKIADRGQGILSSFALVLPDLVTHDDALRVAFTEQITSRQPEDRGRGLKVVASILTQLRGGSFVFRSGNAELSCRIPCDADSISSAVHLVDGTVLGTYCAMVYSYAD